MPTPGFQGTRVTPTFRENSEVSLGVEGVVEVSSLVAVALTTCPACGMGLTQVKLLSSPLALVVAVVCATGI
jgi:hypothetical protein